MALHTIRGEVSRSMQARPGAASRCLLRVRVQQTDQLSNLFGSLGNKARAHGWVEVVPPAATEVITQGTSAAKLFNTLPLMPAPKRNGATVRRT